VIRSFADDATEDIFNGVNPKEARKRLGSALHSIARRKLDMLDAAYVLEDLKAPPANRLEALKGDLKGKHSIRINDQFRIVFRWTDLGVEHVEIIDYH
jgi:proteic killer suppression protein